MTRYMGKSYDAAQKLYFEIQKADKVIQVVSTNRNVYILPEKQYEEIKTQAHQAGIGVGKIQALHLFEDLYAKAEDKAELIEMFNEALQNKN